MNIAKIESKTIRFEYIWFLFLWKKRNTKSKNNKTIFGFFKNLIGTTENDSVEEQKEEKTEEIKKTEKTINLQLLKNQDIISWASENRGAKQFVVGFALETNNALEFALNKLESKKMDMIVLNSME